MKIYLLIGIGAANLGLIVYLLYKQNKNHTETFNYMKSKEELLDEQLASIKSSQAVISGGVTTLIGQVGDLTQKLADVTAANPDLADELQDATDIATDMKATADAIAAALPPPAQTGGDTGAATGDGGGSETGGNSGGDAGSGSDTTTGDGGDVSTNPVNDTPGNVDNPGVSDPGTIEGEPESPVNPNSGSF